MSFTIKHGLFKYDLSDHHAILGIPITSDSKQVRKQYLKIARILHPDAVKGKSDAEKKQASELLSKLVNPAYEQLSKSSTQNEYELVLKQTGKRLTGEKIAIEGEAAKQLAKAAIANIDAAYQSAVKQTALTQYDNLDKVLATIGHLSELNMVYLIRKQGQVSGNKNTAGAGSSNAGAGGAAQGTKTPQQTSATASPAEEKISPAEHYIRRAQEYISKKNFAKAVLELRDALKLEPNNSRGHALIGMSYLKQNQATMAKIHIEKALEFNSKEPLAVQAKEALERITGQTVGTKPSGSKGQQAIQQQKKGLFGGMFGGDKKK